MADYYLKRFLVEFRGRLTVEQDGVQLYEYIYREEPWHIAQMAMRLDANLLRRTGYVAKNRVWTVDVKRDNEQV